MAVKNPNPVTGRTCAEVQIQVTRDSLGKITWDKITILDILIRHVTRNGGSYRSAHVLLNLFNKLEKR